MFKVGDKVRVIGSIMWRGIVVEGKSKLNDDDYILVKWSDGSESFLKEKHLVLEDYQDKISSLEEELTKYKRAFEILKEKLNFELVYDEEYCGDDIWYLDSKSGTEISKEEYELLEELINNENNRHN